MVSIYFKIRKKTFICLVSILMLLTISPLQANQPSSYAIQANIIYHLTKYIDWPDNKKSGDFIIGVIGDTPLYDELKSFLIKKTVGNQKIIVKKIPPSASIIN